MPLLPDHNIIDSVFAVTEVNVLKDERLFESLSAYINNLINSDFERLVSLLYRIDVNENKLKKLLRGNTEANAGRIIASLVIERQLQKLKSRQQSGGDRRNNVDEEESW